MVALGSDPAGAVHERPPTSVTQPAHERDDRVQPSNTAGASAQPGTGGVELSAVTVTLEPGHELLALAEAECRADDQVLVCVRRVDLDRLKIARLPARPFQRIVHRDAGSRRVTEIIALAPVRRRT